jgi:hypothetical protein
MPLLREIVSSGKQFGFVDAFPPLLCISGGTFLLIGEQERDLFSLSGICLLERDIIRISERLYDTSIVLYSNAI